MDSHFSMGAALIVVAFLVGLYIGHRTGWNDGLARAVELLDEAHAKYKVAQLRPPQEAGK